MAPLARRSLNPPLPLPCPAGEQARPSLASYKRLQRDPGLLQRKRGGAALLEEFEAAPWLLPPRTEALPHAGSLID